MLLIISLHFSLRISALYCLGGTLDVTVHAIQGEGAIKEIHKVTGGPHGGIKVNKQFESLLDELFGSKKFRNYRQKYRSDWLTLINDFEAKKRGKRIVESGAMTNILLPRSFVSLVNETQSRALTRYGSSQIKLKNSKYLALSSAMMMKLFSPTLECIKDHLKKLLQQPRLSKVKTMLLVGRFADSAFLQNEIKRAFSSGVRVLIPSHGSETDFQGAVLFGKTAKITES